MGVGCENTAVAMARDITLVSIWGSSRLLVMVKAAVLRVRVVGSCVDRKYGPKSARVQKPLSWTLNPINHPCSNARVKLPNPEVLRSFTLKPSAVSLDSNPQTSVEALLKRLRLERFAGPLADPRFRELEFVG